MEPYPYRPLDPTTEEIRVLDVAPGPHSSMTVTSTLRHISLSASPLPYYEAVSYCWNEASVRGTVTIDGLTVDCPQSSATALRYLRYSDRVRTLWIDALCINQKCIPERNSQVALMRQIYTGAKGTLVWLGEADEDTAGAFEEVDRQIIKMKAEIGDSAFNDFAFWAESATFQNSLDKVEFDESVRPVLKLLQSPWWERLWIVQEVVLARERDCHFDGQMRNLQDIMHQGMWLYQRHKDYLDSASMETNYTSQVWLLALYCANDATLRNGIADCFDIRVMLKQFYGRRATDKRDNIYGMLGLVKGGWHQSTIDEVLKPDYSKSVLEVYRDATMVVFCIEGTLHDLVPEPQQSLEPHDRNSEWPSWVHRWD